MSLIVTVETISRPGHVGLEFRQPLGKEFSSLKKTDVARVGVDRHFLDLCSKKTGKGEKKWLAVGYPLGKETVGKQDGSLTSHTINQGLACGCLNRK